MSNGWVKWLLMEEMRWRTNLSNDLIEKIAAGFMDKMESRRLTILPTYLSDEMYEAQKFTVGAIDYKTASDLYRSALEGHANLTRVPALPEEGGFW
jgi:hypothetical protein